MWRLFELAQGMRAVADRHVLNGCFTKALRLYQHILFAHSDVLFRMERAKTVPGVLCVLLLVDTYLCHAAVELSTPESWPGYAGRWLGYAKALLEGNTDCYQAFFPAFELGAPRQMAIEWLDMLCRLSTIQNAGLQATIRSILEPMKDFRAIMASNNREQVADYFDHDVNYLKTLVPEVSNIASISFVKWTLIDCTGRRYSSNTNHRREQTQPLSVTTADPRLCSARRMEQAYRFAWLP